MRLCHNPRGLWVTIDMVHAERAISRFAESNARGADDHDSSSLFGDAGVERSFARVSYLGKGLVFERPTPI
jgi:hypothetical protein